MHSATFARATLEEVLRRGRHGGRGPHRSAVSTRSERSERAEGEGPWGEPWVLPTRFAREAGHRPRKNRTRRGRLSSQRFSEPVAVSSTASAGFPTGALRPSPYDPRMRLRLTPAPCSLHAGT